MNLCVFAKIYAIV